MKNILQAKGLLSSPCRRAASRGIDFGDLTEEIVADRGARIEKAHAMAEEMKKRLGLDLTWRDILSWPMPEGVHVSVQQRGAPSGKKTKSGSRPAPAPEPTRDSEGDDDN